MEELETLEGILTIQCIREKLVNIRLERLRGGHLRCLDDVAFKKDKTYELHKCSSIDAIYYGNHHYVIGDHGENIKVYLNEEDMYAGRPTDVLFSSYFKPITCNL